MLKGIDHRPNAEVLACPCAIGHGDLLLLADANFPAEALARATVTARRLRMENLSAAGAAAAILSVLPLDSFVDDFAGRMEGVGAPDEVPPVQKEIQAEIDRAEGAGAPDARHRTLRLLRPGPPVPCRDPDRRTALLRLLHVPQGRDPTRGMRA